MFEYLVLMPVLYERPISAIVAVEKGQRSTLKISTYLWSVFFWLNMSNIKHNGFDFYIN